MVGLACYDISRSSLGVHHIAKLARASTHSADRPNRFVFSAQLGKARRPHYSYKEFDLANILI